MEDLKIVSDDYTGSDVEGMPDSPTSESWTAASIKERFDALVKDLVAVRFNALIDLLVSTTEGEGASQLGVEAIADVTGTNAQAVFEDLKAQIDAAVVAGLVEGTVGDEYLGTDEEDILARYAAHIINYLLHIGDAGTTGGTTAAYTATLSDFSAASKQFFVVVANATNAINATLTLNGGTAYQIVTRSGANVAAGHMQSGGTYLIMWDGSSKYVLLNPATIDDHTHAQSSITDLVTALAAKQATITGAATTIATSNLTASRALVANSSGKVAVSAVTDTELGYLDGVTSAIQTQLNAKLATSKIIYQSATPTVVSGAIWLKPV